MKIRFLFFILFIFFISILTCKPKKKSEVDGEVLSFLVSQRTPIDSACQKFLLSEASCISSPDNAVVVCTSLIGTLKAKISPAEKATDAVAELYFNCLAETNVLYNQGIGCGKTSFNTTSDYRRGQRGTSSGSSSNAIAAWKAQFNNCASIDGGVPPASSGLRETNSRLTSDPFQ
jgi:hypothetical protein